MSIKLVYANKPVKHTVANEKKCFST